MADFSLVTADKVFVIESLEQMTLPTDEAITAGMAVRIATATGKFTKANGTTTGEYRAYGIATTTVAAGFPVTAIAKGVMAGWDFGSANYDADVYLSDTDGRLADATGTQTKRVGQVIPAWSQKLGVAADRLLRVDL